MRSVPFDPSTITVQRLSHAGLVSKRNAFWIVITWHLRVRPSVFSRSSLVNTIAATFQTVPKLIGKYPLSGVSKNQSQEILGTP